MTTPTILVIGVGGLGTRLVEEALDRGLRLSVLVRDPDKLATALTPEQRAKLALVYVGDGTDPQALDEAMAGVDVVLSGRGAAPDMAEAVAQAAARNHVHKLVWPGGTTNVLADDGVTLNYKTLTGLGSWVKEAYHRHQRCIDAIRASGVNYVVFCPGNMAGRGHRSADVNSTIRVNRDAGPFVCYEDAAWVILEAATTPTWDGQLISAATLQDT